jgi:hypothetical protein
MREFPRSSGHCAAIDVSKFVENFEDEISAEQLKNDVLDILYDFNYNLVRGDLICFEGLDSYRNDGVAIYDGCKIINLDHVIDDYGALPKEFTVINNEVPIDYWYNTENNKGIDHNHLVWFDHTSVKKQCIDNIIEEEGDLFTTFKYNNKIYTIITSKFDYSDEIKLTKEKFDNILSTNDPLLFDGEFGDES